MENKPTPDETYAALRTLQLAIGQTLHMSASSYLRLLNIYLTPGKPLAETSGQNPALKPMAETSGEMLDLNPSNNIGRGVDADGVPLGVGRTYRVYAIGLHHGKYCQWERGILLYVGAHATPSWLRLDGAGAADGVALQTMRGIAYLVD